MTHRVVGVDARHQEFLFRGDANPVADPEPVPASAITGRVWFSVPYVGWIRARLGQSRSILIVLAVVGLGVYSVAQFTLAWRERSRRL